VADRAQKAVAALASASERAPLYASLGIALLANADDPSKAGARATRADEMLALSYRDASQSRRHLDMAIALGLSGELRGQRGEPKAAIEALDRAVAISRAAGDDPWRYRWLWQLGKARAATGDTEGARRDLEKAVAGGRFREDLYYRLNVVPIQLPPLRERPGDVAELARFFVARLAPRMGRKVTGIAPEALALLERHRWPGNVRELENVIEQALVFADGDLVRPGDLPEGLRRPAPAAGLPVPSGEKSLTAILEELEEQLILSAYERARGVKAETARLLGIKPSALYYKLEKYGIGGAGEGQGE
jgi:tetratricopeptide (TPR) repeat protein